MAALDDLCANLCEGGPSLEFRALKPASSNLGYMTDDVVTRAASEINWNLGESYSAERTKQVLVRFWNMYFSGLIGKGDSCFAIITDAIVMFRYEGESLLARKGTREMHDSRPGTAELKDEFEHINTQSDFVSSNWSDVRRAEYLKLMKTFEPSAAPAMRNLVQEIICSDGHEYRQRLENITAYLALYAVRFVIKEAPRVAAAYQRGTLVKNMASILGWDRVEYYPPCAKFLDLAQLTFVKNLPPTTRLMSCLLSSYKEARAKGGASQVLLGFLTSGLLTHTSYNGMGLFLIFDSCMELTQMSWAALCTHTYTEHTSKSWTALINMVKFYESPERSQDVCYPWARIVNDGYNRGLSPKENPDLMHILAGIVLEAMPESQIEEANWFSGESYAVEVEMGRVLYERKRGRNKALSGTKEAREIMSEAKKKLDKSRNVPTAQMDDDMELFQGDLVDE